MGLMDAMRERRSSTESQVAGSAPGTVLGQRIVRVERGPARDRRWSLPVCHRLVLANGVKLQFTPAQKPLEYAHPRRSTVRYLGATVQMLIIWKHGGFQMIVVQRSGCRGEVSGEVLEVQTATPEQMAELDAGRW